MNNELLKKEEKKIETKDCCVCINVFTKCEQCKTYEQGKMGCKPEKKDDECCVCINVFAECE